jgi:hypothetical protein
MPLFHKSDQLSKNVTTTSHDVDIIGAKMLGSNLVDDEILSKEKREEHPID